VSASQCLLPTELNFYQAYAWCLNPYPTVREAIDYLRGEIGRLEIVPVGCNKRISAFLCTYEYCRRVPAWSNLAFAEAIGGATSWA
jgi:hypothetical protein